MTDFECVDCETLANRPVLGTTDEICGPPEQSWAAQIEDFGPYLTQEDIAKVLGISGSRLRNWYVRGKLPAYSYRIGARAAWSRKQIKQLCRDLEALAGD